MKHLISIIVLLIALACSTKAQEHHLKTTYRLISADEFKEKMSSENIQIIDVRTPEEYKRGTIDGAINIDVLDPNFKKRINQLNASHPTLVFCARGSRSARASAVLKAMEFKEVYDLRNGFATFR